MNNSRGFTIVELLIVIVVIGILAAITIVAFNGIQQRAKNTSTISAAQQSIKLIKAYRAANDDTYPMSGTACLTNTCTDYAGTAAAVDSGLRTNLGKIGNPPTSTPVAGSGKYYGIWYNIRAGAASYDGDSTRKLLLMYWLTGQAQDCGVSDVAIQATGEAWARSTNKYSYSYPADNTTACWVSV
ncbi:MAG: type II secretion system protein [Sphingobacteriales bacterium]|nr:MAG: type II secretion system protein [Sphingobacteriales bacterium]